MRLTKTPERRQLNITASSVEIEQLELIKKFYKRRTNADAVRFLIESEAERILPWISTIAVSDTATK